MSHAHSKNPDYAFIGLTAQIEREYASQMKEILALVDELTGSQARTMLKILFSREDTDRTMALLLTEIINQRGKE